MKQFSQTGHYEGLINRYREYLPVTDTTPVVTLNEGNTPLVKADNLARKIGLDCEIYLKFEGANPTGSFKDRGMTMAVTKAKEAGAKAIICASTGNTSAAAAAYGAKAGLKTYVLIPDGYIALGKLSQAMMYGAEIIAIKGNFDEALERVIEISEKYPVTLVNSVNPYRIGDKKPAHLKYAMHLAMPRIITLSLSAMLATLLHTLKDMKNTTNSAKQLISLK